MQQTQQATEVTFSMAEARPKQVALAMDKLGQEDNLPVKLVLLPSTGVGYLS
ncbi:unnamed protein product [Trifolium pratense]|uniref:Uncharacterized protein n=1 Tax=Trifolium pratense TaxID=57577 RepID=A0ACB0IJC1_TRIPR|nr:unnamed protein product [Trifolium pratense]